jgi:hypothetical protein
MPSRAHRASRERSTPWRVDGVGFHPLPAEVGTAAAGQPVTHHSSCACQPAIAADAMDRSDIVDQQERGARRCRKNVAPDGEARTLPNSAHRRPIRPHLQPVPPRCWAPLWDPACGPADRTAARRADRVMSPRLRLSPNAGAHRGDGGTYPAGPSRFASASIQRNPPIMLIFL